MLFISPVPFRSRCRSLVLLELIIFCSRLDVLGDRFGFSRVPGWSSHCENPVLLARFHCFGHDIQTLQHPAVAHHSLPRNGLPVRLPSAHDAGHRQLPSDSVVHSQRSCAFAHRDIWDPREVSHCPPRSKEQKHPGEEEWTVLHSRSG